MFESAASDDYGPGDAGGNGSRPRPAAATPSLAGLERMAPGAELAGLLEMVHPGEVTDAYDLVELVAACRRLKAWADGIEVETAAALARHPVCDNADAARHGFSPLRAAGQLIAARIGVAPSTGADRVAVAAQLVEELPDTVTALRRGEIDYPKAAALAVGVRALDPPDGMQDAVTGESITLDGVRRGLIAAVEARVLPKAGRRSARQHRDAIARAVAALAPNTAEQRHQEARQQRHVASAPAPDAMAWLNLYGPAEDVTAIQVMLDAAADAATTQPDETRTADQLRFDSLAALAWASLDSGHLGGCGHGCGPRLGRRHGRAAAVQVTVPVSTLIGLDDTPGELDGYGPIPAQVARRIAAHGSWRRLLTDPATGALLDYGQTRYPPPADLVEHVIARDKTCRFPTCSQPARRCQIDHTIPAGSTGWSTSAGNTGPLSAGCHNSKTHAGWHLEQPEPGRYTWTAPTGHTYTVDPEIIGPIVKRAGPQPALPPGDPPELEPPPDLDFDPPPF
ncbi:MAG: DUF222 domain-containing protein [Jiangellaceae bacterium]